MKFSIFINQKRLKEIAPEIKLKEALILDYIKGLCLSTSEKIIRKDFEGKQYTWINYTHLRTEMPLLELNQGASITKAVQNLEAFRYIETFKEYGTNTKFVRLGKLYDALEFDSGIEMPDEEEEQELGPDSEIEEQLNQPEENTSEKEAPVSCSKQGLLVGANRAVSCSKHISKLNINKLNNQIADKSANLDKNQNNFLNPAKKKFSLSAVSSRESSSESRVRALVAPEHLEILEVYRELFYRGCNSKTKALVEGVPYALNKFQEFFPHDAKEKFCEALRLLAKEEWIQPSNLKSVNQISPKTMFSTARVENYLLPLAFKNNGNRTLSNERPRTEEELRAIEEADERLNADRMARLS